MGDDEVGAVAGVDQDVVPAVVLGEVDVLALAGGIRGLECSVSEDQADAPGLIQEVSLTLDGWAKSSTIVDSVTAARSPTAAVRHGVARGSVAVTEAFVIEVP